MIASLTSFKAFVCLLRMHDSLQRFCTPLLKFSALCLAWHRVHVFAQFLVVSTSDQGSNECHSPNCALAMLNIKLFRIALLTSFKKVYVYIACARLFWNFPPQQRSCCFALRLVWHCVRACVAGPRILCHSTSASPAR